MENIKNHWEKVYQTKTPNEVSWTQEVPKTSLNFINWFKLSKDAPIIDVGGGDSKLVDYLIEQGYTNITVLDISKHAIAKAKLRLGLKSRLVNWVVNDITEYQPDRIFQIWHDRATFHFLTSEEHIIKYLEIVKNKVSGYLVIGTFSDKGPDKCSGLVVNKYSQEQLANRFENDFTKSQCINEDHYTPFNTVQNFTFCSFKRK